MTLTLGTFNVKDLFEAHPAKLANLADFLDAMDADVLGLQEVGSEAALDALLARVPALGYVERLVGTPDSRGIRNALVSRFPLASAQVHTSAAIDFPRFAAGDPPPFGARVPLRRGVVHARVRVPEMGDVDVLVAHFKSGRAVPFAGADGAAVIPASDRERAEGQLRALILRASEALFVRGLVDEILAAAPDAKVAVVGDLNDSPSSLPVRIVSGTTLSSCVSGYSIIHSAAREQIDHVLVSASLAARLVGSHVFNESLRDHGALAQGPLLQPQETAALAAPDSDHAPLVARFRLR